MIEIQLYHNNADSIMKLPFLKKLIVTITYE